MRTSSLAVAALVFLLAGGSVAGCAGDDRSGAPPVDSSASPGSSVSPGPSGSPSLGGGGVVPPSRPFGPSNPPSKYAEGELTLTGRPEAGVESGCTVMRSGDKLYLLLGGDRELLRSGRTVVVRGRPNPGLITTCQQGIPFDVTEVRAA